MSEHKTLLQFLLDLLHDKSALADFREDPQGALHAAGLANCSVDDVKDLLPVVLEKVDPEKCAKYEDDCDKGDCHDDAPKHHDPHHGGHHWSSDPGCDDDHKPAHHQDSEIDKVVTHLNYVTNNYSFDSHDTIYNTNNITKIWADHGANVEVNNDTHNVGAGGSSIEGDNNGTVATGGHNQIGDGNMQSGDGSTTAFGSGSALSHVGTGDGGAINTGTGAAAGNHADTTLTSFGGGTVQNGAGNVATDSHDHVSTDSHNITDSQNHTSTDSHAQDNSDHSVNTDTSSHYDDSYNTLSHDDNSVDNSIDHSTVHDPAFALIPGA
ncbi:IniB N-terminal domain-containing protein [Actinomycetospora sp.]|jgi:hypothetical protein|uniref:IniB N-terminal domain-containing protein n=1 Tax=Actinomycetospora sp. TaxID=1872135 RepID=UPI002F42D6B5